MDISSKNIDVVWRALEAKTCTRIEKLTEIIKEPTTLQNLRMQFEDLKRTQGKVAAINGLGSADQKVLILMAQDVERCLNILNRIMRSDLRGCEEHFDIAEKMAERMLLFFESYHERLQIYGFFFVDESLDTQRRGLNTILNYVPTAKANQLRERQKTFLKKQSERRLAT